MKKLFLFSLSVLLSVAAFCQQTVDFEKVPGGASMTLNGRISSYIAPVVTMSSTSTAFAIALNDQIYTFKTSDNITINGNVITAQTGLQITALLQASVFVVSDAYYSPVFDYYVSSITGSDQYNGTTPLTPKKTIAAISSLLTTGKKLGIERGSYFREQLVVTANNVTVGTYGAGSNPVFDASNVVPAGNFTKTGGLTNVYQFTMTVLTNATGQATFSVFENGQRLARVVSNAACDALPGSFFSPTPSSGTAATIVINAIGSTNPISDNNVYEVTTRDCGIDAITSLRFTASGITTKRNINNDGSFRGGFGTHVSNSTFLDGSKHNLYVDDSALVENCTAQNSEGYDAMFVYHTATGVGTYGSTFKNCRAYGGYAYGQGSTAYLTANGFYCHTQTGTLLLANYIDCYAENVAAGFGGEASTLNLTRCSVYLAKALVNGQPLGGTMNIVSCFIDQRDGGSYQKSVADNASMITVNGGTANISGCVFMVNPSAYGEFIFSSSASTIINATKNTFAAVSSAAGFIGLVKSNTGTATFTQNIFYGIEGIYANYTNNLLTMVADKNVYYRTSTGLQFRQLATNYTSFSTWQAVPEDPLALNVDPVFTNPIAAWHKISDAVPSTSSVVTLQAGATYY